MIQSRSIKKPFDDLVSSYEPRSENDTTANVKSRFFTFLWKNKRDKIKRDVIYQNFEKGGLRMIDFEIMTKALRLAWIPRPLENSKRNWKIVPEHFFKRRVGS